ncbi:MAG: hypothetical protein JSW63_10760 [Ignavibacterium sp.]|nr:MAG: hypothetical protein JSW63_10760 [Ignavibacterium sp.]
MSTDDAQSLISGTYKKLINEGGPWPFRLAENQLSGYLILINKSEMVLLERAKSYRDMLFQILPLTLSTILLFRGNHFKERWKKFITTVRKTFPLRFCFSLLLSPFYLAFLIIMVGFGNLIYLVNPGGSQPTQIRKVYPILSEN